MKNSTYKKKRQKSGKLSSNSLKRTPAPKGSRSRKVYWMWPSDGGKNLAVLISRGSEYNHQLFGRQEKKHWVVLDELHHSSDVIGDWYHGTSYLGEVHVRRRAQGDSESLSKRYKGKKLRGK